MLNSNISSTRPDNMVNFSPVVAEIDWCLGFPSKFHWVLHLGFVAVDLGGLKEAQVQSYSPGGANVPSVPLNHPCAAAMRHVVKLLCPLIIKNTYIVLMIVNHS